MNRVKFEVYHPALENVDINTKCIYTDCFIKTDCPSCGKENKATYNTNTLLYVPSEYKNVTFCCDFCCFEKTILNLVDLNNNIATLEKDKDFKSEITCYKMVPKIVPMFVTEKVDKV